MKEDAELYRSYQIMEILGCASLSELSNRLGPATNYLGWLTYLERKDELEAQKMKAMMGENR
jgi:hypothetical protein